MRLAQRGPMLLVGLLLAQIGLGIDRERLPGPAPTSVPVVTSKAVPCASAADPALESASAQKRDTRGGTDDFVIHASVLNRGKIAQRSSSKQEVSVYRNEEKIGNIAVPPLEPGEAFAFTTRFKRSSEAGTGTTTLILRLRGLNYPARGSENCNDRNDTIQVTF